MNLCGVSKSVPTVFKTAYNSSKFAMEGYVESLSQQLFRAEHLSKQQAMTTDPQGAQPKNVRIGQDFDISFITMSVGEWDMKSRRISISVPLGPTDDIKQKLLGDDTERKEHGQDDVKNGVTFQKWATNTVPLISSLMDGNGLNNMQQQSRYCSVDRIIDLQSMLKAKGT